MDVELTDERQLLLETVSRFTESACPMGKVRALHDADDSVDRGTWAKAAGLGLAGMLVPERYGGSASSEHLLDAVLVAEVLGRFLAPWPFQSTNLVALSVAEEGTEEQRERVLPGLASGEVISAWCIAEGRFRDPADMGLEARPLNGGRHVLQGRKSFVVDGIVADQLLVPARSPEGLSQFLVRSDSPGVRVRPMESLDLGRRLAVVDLESVEVGPEALVGPPHDAARSIKRMLEVALVMQCAETSGILDRTLEFTLEYAHDRVAFGRPIGSYQALKHRLADMKIWLEACHATTAAAARAVQARGEDAGELVSIAKSYVGEKAPFMIQDCLQIHGGIGLTWEHDIHLYLRRATVNAALYGSAADHRERVTVFALERGEP